MGRPSTLDVDETAAVVKYFGSIRPEGGSVDRETLQVLAKEAVKKNRGLNSGEVKGVYFNDSWSRDFKHRQGWIWRSGDTDRKPSTIADIVEDNKWRKFVQDVFDNPSHHGILCLQTPLP